MLRILFLGFRFRAKQADDQRDRLLTGQRTLQLEALLGSLFSASAFCGVV